MPRQRNYTKMRTPIRLEEVLADPEILAVARDRATKARAPLTVWPSTHYGEDYIFTSRLVTWMSVPCGGKVPPHTAPGSEALLTVLPDGYYPTREELDELERLGWPLHQFDAAIAP